MDKIILAIIIVIIIITLAVLWYTTAYNVFYKGIWIATNSFCRDAGIDEMIIFIGPEKQKRFASTHGGYIIIRVDGIAVENKYIELVITPKFSPYRFKKYYTVTIIDPDSNEPSIDIMQPNMSMELDILKNTLIMTHDDEVYADLVKDNTATNMLSIIRKMSDKNNENNENNENNDNNDGNDSNDSKSDEDEHQ